jgi:hypothetical protein
MAHIPTARYPVCPFCTEHVELETANTDEKGQAVHEACYAAYIASQVRVLQSASRGLLILGAVSRASKHENIAETFRSAIRLL